jgi:hypothetical protein
MATKIESAFDWRAHVAVHPAADLFPLMPADELRALADDIKANGLRTQIIFDGFGNLLDGRNRLDALALLDLLCVKDNRISWKDGALKWRIEEGDPYDIVLSMNVHRRHLTAEQKRELIAKVLKANPEKSNREIARQVKDDHKKVARVREAAESTGALPQLERTVGKDGKERPTKRKTKPKADEGAGWAGIALSLDPSASAAAMKAKHAAAEKPETIEGHKDDRVREVRENALKQFKDACDRCLPQMGTLELAEARSHFDWACKREAAARRSADEILRQMATAEEASEKVRH